jgi:hypothetical protein
MTNLRKTMLALSAVTILSGCSLNDGVFSKKPFAAVYRVTTQGEPTTQEHVFYDGDGHVRTQTIAPYSNNFYIVDFRRNEADGILESQKQYLHVSNLKGYQRCIYDEASAKSLHAKSLGAKKIGQYKCHGWLYEDGDGNREVWTSDEYSCPVQDSFRDSKGRKISRRLIGYEGTNVIDGLFKVPDGYTAMSRSSFY